MQKQKPKESNRTHEEHPATFIKTSLNIYPHPKQKSLKVRNVKDSLRGVIMEMGITKISKKGQIVIPAEIRRDLDIKTSDKFMVFGKKDTILIKKIRNKKRA